MSKDELHAFRRQQMLMSNSLHIFHTKDSCDNTFIRLINGGIFNVQR